MSSSPQPEEFAKDAAKKVENQSMTAGDLLGSTVKVTPVIMKERRTNTTFAREPTNEAQIMLSTMHKRAGRILVKRYQARMIKGVEIMVDGPVCVAVVDTDIGKFTGWSKFNPNDVSEHTCTSKRGKSYQKVTSKYNTETGKKLAIHKALKRAVGER